jgi:hypothetical protein
VYLSVTHCSTSACSHKSSDKETSVHSGSIFFFDSFHICKFISPYVKMKANSFKIDGILEKLFRLINIRGKFDDRDPRPSLLNNTIQKTLQNFEN